MPKKKKERTKKPSSRTSPQAKKTVEAVEHGMDQAAGGVQPSQEQHVPDRQSAQVSPRIKAKAELAQVNEESRATPQEPVEDMDGRKKRPPAAEEAPPKKEKPKKDKK